MKLPRKFQHLSSSIGWQSLSKSPLTQGLIYNVPKSSVSRCPRIGSSLVFPITNSYGEHHDRSIRLIATGSGPFPTQLDRREDDRSDYIDAIHCNKVEVLHLNTPLCFSSTQDSSATERPSLNKMEGSSEQFTRVKESVEPIADRIADEFQRVPDDIVAELDQYSKTLVTLQHCRKHVVISERGPSYIANVYCLQLSVKRMQSEV